VGTITHPFLFWRVITIVNQDTNRAATVVASLFMIYKKPISIITLQKKPYQNQMKIDKSLTINIILASIAIIACISSMRSCAIAEKAVEVTQGEFVKENRPYLIISPEKFEDSNHYCDLTKTDQDELQLRLKFKIENIGKVAALNVTSPGNLDFFDKSGKVNVSAAKELPVITLGPGEHIYRTFEIKMMGDTPDWAEITINDLKAKKEAISVIWFSLNYSNEIEPSIAYETRGAYSFSMNSAQLLVLETERIKE